MWSHSSTNRRRWLRVSHKPGCNSTWLQILGRLAAPVPVKLGQRRTLVDRERAAGQLGEALLAFLLCHADQIFTVLDQQIVQIDGVADANSLAVQQLADQHIPAGAPEVLGAFAARACAASPGAAAALARANFMLEQAVMIAAGS